MIDVIAVMLRALSFIAVMQAAGIPLFLSLLGEGLGRAGSSIASLGRYSAAAGLALTVAYQVIVPAQLLASLRGVFDFPLQMTLLASDAGAAHALRVMGLAMVVLGGLGRHPLRATAALIGATLIVVSFAFMGHTSADDRRWLLAALLIVHLLIVAFWFGSLLPLYLAGKHEDVTTNGLLVERFSVLAIGLVPVIFLAGVALSIGLLPNLASLRTPYGTLLLTKIFGFALLMALASFNKWRLGPLIRAGDASALRVLQRSVVLEWGLIAAVLAVTAAMTALFSPAH